jgi:hypothetical protein
VVLRKGLGVDCVSCDSSLRVLGDVYVNAWCCGRRRWHQDEEAQKTLGSKDCRGPGFANATQWEENPKSTSVCKCRQSVGRMKYLGFAVLIVADEVLTILYVDFV